MSAGNATSSLIDSSEFQQAAPSSVRRAASAAPASLRRRDRRAGRHAATARRARAGGSADRTASGRHRAAAPDQSSRRHLDLRAEGPPRGWRWESSTWRSSPWRRRDGMRLHADGDEEVAVLAAVAPDVSCACTANPRLVDANPGGSSMVSVSVRISTCCPPQVGQRVRLRRSRPAAVGTRPEGTIARADFTTPVPWQGEQRVSLTFSPADAAAHAAMLLPRDRDGTRAADAHPQGDGDGLMQVSATFHSSAGVLVALRGTRPQRRSPNVDASAAVHA